MKYIRVFYEKTGRAKYLSHLELNRAMQRAIKRSGIPVWYTQGFNPHIYITFALPAPLGQESLCESFDIRLEEDIPHNEVKEKLAACMPQGINIMRVAEPVLKADEIALAEYTIEAHSETQTPEELCQRFSALLARTDIPAEKRTKKGVSEIDLKPHIKLIACQSADGCAVIKLRLPAGAALNINPELVVNAATRLEGTDIDMYAITKEKLYTKNGEIFH